ncbi:PREDICTED: GDP-fucose transporter 1 [Diuraphis noxia]|uniref:GDP-fucose transporter 1 n=1 Tax=Diuraphis noxia TaxID=143948 RepID=UPI000763B17B|nr:PREDICTED: GDP-fucose transporter 1 [Diuraphis noxia]
MKLDTLSLKYIQIFFVVVIYWVISILTVFVNKTLLSIDKLDVDAPIFIAWFQCLVSAMICFTLSRLSKIFPTVVQFPEGNPFNKTTIKKVLPLSILYILMISTNNYCLKFVDVTFYYVGRSLTTVFNVILSYIILERKEVTSPLTHNISGTAKSCFQTVLASFWYNQWKSSMWWFSNFVVLGGSAAYTIVKNREMEKKYRPIAYNRC